jgi:ATP-dependent Clp protease ATP-binding subunit ClpA
MFQRFTEDARAVVIKAHEHARRLHHQWIGCEHILMALAAGDDAVGETLRAAGATPDKIEATILHQIGPSRDLFDELDREALAAVGIDVDAVRKAVENSFGPGALRNLRHYRSQQCGPRTRRFPPWRGRRRQRAGRNFTRRAKGCLEGAAKEAVRTRTGYVGTQHLAQSALSMKYSTISNILKAIGADPAVLRTTISDKYRQA